MNRSSLKSLHLVVPMACLAFLAACSPEPETGHSPEQDQGWPGGLIPPIEGATFPLAPGFNPGAPAEGHAGTRQGFAFSGRNAGRILSPNQPAVAVASGEIVRIDHSYSEPDLATLEYWTSIADTAGHAGAWALDRLRGRQVWIRHAGGHISRYAHLSQVHPELAPGDAIEQGEPVGLIGSSGRLPSDDRPAAPVPLLHYELWSADGSRYLGEGLELLELHRLLAERFSEEALPRYARQVLADLESGQAPPDVYPPSDLGSTGFSADMPEAITPGTAFTIPITWPATDFQTQSLIVGLDERPMGILEAEGGAIAVGAIEFDADRAVATVSVGAVDKYGQTLTGSRTVPVSEPADAPPLEVDGAILEANTAENREQELARLHAAAQSSLGQHTPAWNQPFQAPVDGQIVGEFGQKLFHGMLRPQHPLPGILVAPSGDGVVKASNDGVVALVAELPIRGSTVAVAHGGGIITVYARLEDVSVSENDRIQRGEPIGRLARSGDLQDRVLLWEVHAAGTPTNPRDWLNQVLPQQLDGSPETSP